MNGLEAGVDVVCSYHTNPLTCGVARFNQALADGLGLPVAPLFSAAAREFKAPLLSIKVSEMRPAAIDQLTQMAEDRALWPDLSLFFHQYSGTEVEDALIARAKTIYCANAEIVQQIGAERANVVRAWCPGFLFEKRLIPHDAQIKCYTFGMAHKLKVGYYRELKALLDASGRTYVVLISAAVHEDTSLDDSFTAAYEELKEIFGEKVFFLGFVSDGALYSYLTEATYFVAFFKDGVRDNNTSVNTAMQCGAVVLTNLDASSPPEFVHGQTVVDINQLDGALPTDREELEAISERAKVAAEVRGWAPLLALMRNR